LDENAVPPEYVLLPRSGKYVDPMEWQAVETQLRDALASAAGAANLPQEDLLKFTASATHHEILAGLGSDHADHEHVFAFVRDPERPKEAAIQNLIESLRRTLPYGN